MNKKNDYNLLHIGVADTSEKKSTRKYLSDAWTSGKEFAKYIAGDKFPLLVAFIFIILNSVAGVVTPYYVSKSIDIYIANKDAAGLVGNIVFLIFLYILTAIFGYFQSRMMGSISQRTLFRLRAALFAKLQSLPVAFFNQNKTGDLMSRLNNDTDKLNEFLSQSVARFVGSFFVVFGIAVFIFFLNWKLAFVLLASTLIIFTITQAFSSTVEHENSTSLKAYGLLSSSVQENISNFKVMIAFDRRDYFVDILEKSNEANYKKAIRAGIANHVYEPFYDFSGNTAQLLVLVAGIYLIMHGELTIGFLIGFLSYAQKFYDPLRILATILGNIQTSLASWSRIRAILSLESDLYVLPQSEVGRTEIGEVSGKALLEFDHVSFHYAAQEEEDANGVMVTRTKTVIDDVSFVLEPGKTYAIVGPTGGGKTTLSSLMSRLYDPTSGQVYLDGKDIRTYTKEELGGIISVILQEPFLFTGTVGDNIRYGNPKLQGATDETLSTLLKEKGMEMLLERFQDGLSTKITSDAEYISLGQKQLVSFIRIVLREPRLLILDEATANIDTVTEAVLNTSIELLPKTTTKVIIAHRLNTIKNADVIMFVSGGRVEKAQDVDDAIRRINNAKRST